MNRRALAAGGLAGLVAVGAAEGSGVRPTRVFTAIPHGHRDGAGLPVCLILHGVTATPSDYQSLGLGRFLTAAVRRGAPPFVPARADGGLLLWEPDPAGGDDPQRMVIDEMPRWLALRGDDTTRIAAWVWSMGTTLGIWIGTSDPLVADVQASVARLPTGPQVLVYGDGAHTRAYWDRVTLPAFAFVGNALTPPVAA